MTTCCIYPINALIDVNPLCLRVVKQKKKKHYAVAQVREQIGALPLALFEENLGDHAERQYVLVTAFQSTQGASSFGSQAQMPLSSAQPVGSPTLI